MKFALGELEVTVGHLDYLQSTSELTAWAEEKRSEACTIVAIQVNGTLARPCPFLKDSIHAAGGPRHNFQTPQEPTRNREPLVPSSSLQLLRWLWRWRLETVLICLAVSARGRGHSEDPVSNTLTMYKYIYV